MLKGLYAAASAMLANLNRQSVLTHNLVNQNTPGFRQLLSTLEPFESTEVRRSDPRLPAALLGNLGLGVEAGEQPTDFTAGALQMTGEPLDLAITGEGFFRVQTPAGERFTRDCRFLRDAAGALVTVDGYAVLDAAGAPITLPLGDPQVTPDGRLLVDGAQAAQLGLAVFADPAADLERDPAAGNLFLAAGAPSGTGPGDIVQGYVEAANVNPAQLMTQMTAVSRAYEAAQRLVQTQDELLGRSIASLGRW